VLVGVVAAGLVISDVVTYHALRSFLTTRVDQQLEQAAFPVGRALLSESGLGTPLPSAPSTRHSSATGSTSFPTRHPGTLGSSRALLGGSRTSARGLLVTPGTYGQIRSASGKVEAHVFFSYGGQAPSAPVLPATLPGAGRSAANPLFFTASSTGSGAVSYRVLARPLAQGAGVIVVAVPLTDLDGTLSHLLLIELAVSLVLLVGLGAVSWVMVRRELRPLQSITGTAVAISRGDLSQRVPSLPGTTEVGQLGAAFNTMVDDIEVAFAERAASEERLRRFLADASHELRTPLTSILGYAELFDLGVRDRPEDLARSLRTIRSEATRMATLVDELLWLAKLDHERPLAHQPVDLVALADEAVASLGVVHPGRPVGVETEGRVVVMGDEQRLRQVLDNLLVNAVTHTPAEAGIQLRVGARARSAVVVVHDDGPGIDPADVTRIFEPFYRADPSRDRRSGGSGLGLAIVAAIVEAHRGSVTAVPGEGATFEVRIPLAPTGAEAPPTVVPDAVSTGPGAPVTVAADGSGVSPGVGRPEGGTGPQKAAGGTG
jgi:two-component system OmpR family sensor kinase